MDTLRLTAPSRCVASVATNLGTSHATAQQGGQPHRSRLQHHQPTPRRGGRFLCPPRSKSTAIHATTATTARKRIPPREQKACHATSRGMRALGMCGVSAPGRCRAARSCSPRHPIRPSGSAWTQREGPLGMKRRVQSGSERTLREQQRRTQHVCTATLRGTLCTGNRTERSVLTATHEVFRSDRVIACEHDWMDRN